VAPSRRSLRHSAQLLATPGTSARADAKMSSEDVSELDETRIADEQPRRG
jgi:hypothetical protein